ncbi:importin-4 [Acipenser ruthenus]|uniref:importin-4 n=1 Tax=Acipenser ruthenus TaxID=7906 RepID=UPI0027422226|nr:importin-4 [Acipenser ruthenus]
MTDQLEHILSQLVQPDNAIIQQATAQLKQAFKDPAVIPALCGVMTTSQDAQIRQFAAVMVRMRVLKRWRKLAPDIKENLKALVLQALQQETEHKVRHSLSQLASVLVKHETPDHWPALLNFLNQSTKSANPQERQIGLLVLSKVMDSNPEPFKPHYKQLLKLFGTTLEDHGNTNAMFYSIQTLSAMAAFLGAEELNLTRTLIPKLMVAIKHLIQANQVQASEAMEVFDELMENEMPIIVPHVSEVVQFCLEIAANTTLEDSVRVKALSCLSFLIRLKGKAILKQKLLPPILQVLFPVMSAAPPHGEEDPEDLDPEPDEIEDELEAHTPKHYAAQVIDMLALHLPAEKLFNQLTPMTEAALCSENPYHRKAGLMCLAVLAEGCADHIRQKHLPAMLQVMCRSLGDESQVVRNAALFALGQFSEHLQPDISKYSDELMPLLLNYLSGIDSRRGGHVTKAYYALENFVENLGDKIEPYLPTLMERMLTSLTCAQSIRIKELSVSAIGAIANAAKGALLPYFQPVIDNLKGYLVNTREEVRSLQIQSLETLGVLARTIGKDVFSPLADECVQLGLNLSNTVDDPDLRRCTYGLFASLSTVSPASLIPHLPTITTLMMMSLKSTEGVTAHLTEESQPFLLLDDDDVDDENEDSVIEDVHGDPEEERDVAGFSVENAYIDEKEDACDALGEISFHSGSAFLPYIESCFQEVYKMHDFPHENVRKAAYDGMGQFCRTLHKVWKENPTELNREALHKLLSMVFPAYLKSVKEERDRQVVMSVLETMNEMLKDCGVEAIRTPGRLDQICKAIRDILQKKAACQDGDDYDEDEQQAEFDSMLQEYAGEGIPLLALAAGPQEFAPYFAGFLPLLLVKTKSSCTVADRSFSIGTIAETLQALGGVAMGTGGVAESAGVVSRFASKLLPVLMGGVRDEDDEVRSNSVFAVGALVEASGEALTLDYPALLGVFSNLVSRETNKRVLDNVCAALSRMTVCNLPCVPVEQVFPVLLRHLPLKEDLEENTTVYNCLAFVYSNKQPLVIQHLRQVLNIFSEVLGTEQIKTDTQNTLLMVLQDIAQRYPQELQSIVMSLPADRAATLTAALSEDL